MALQGFNIDDFKANFEDMARSYTFMIMLDMPGDFIGTDKAKYLINATTLPDSTLEPIDVNWQGQIFSTGSNQTFADWVVTFRMDKDGRLRKNFLDWHRAIHNPETNVHGNPNDYMRDQEVWHLNPQGDPIQKLQLISAWPTTIAGYTLDYGTKEYVTFDVTFKYLYYRIL